MQAARGTALSDIEDPLSPNPGPVWADPAAVRDDSATELPAPVEVDNGSHPDTTPTRPRRLGVFAAVAAFALAADVVSKVLVVANLEPGVPKQVLSGGLYLLLTRNAGAAFSLGTGATLIFSLIAVVVIVVIVRTAARLRSVGWAIALGLVLGGALGNLADRVLRAPGWGRGHVVDWISVFADDGHVWPIFNLADSAIDCGGVLAAVLALLGIGFDGRRSDRSSRDKSVSTPEADAPERA